MFGTDLRIDTLKERVWEGAHFERTPAVFMALEICTAHEPLEVPLFYRIPACHVTVFYYMGFACPRVSRDRFSQNCAPLNYEINVSALDWVSFRRTRIPQILHLHFTAQSTVKFLTMLFRKCALAVVPCEFDKCWICALFADFGRVGLFVALRGCYLERPTRNICELGGCMGSLSLWRGATLKH